MRFCFNVELPDKDLQVGIANMQERSLVGYSGREYNRFYPVVIGLEALARVDEWQYARYAKAGQPLPSVYSANLKVKPSAVYKAEAPGEEEWLDVVHILRQGWGDCEDLACARVGELRWQGIAAVPAIKSKRFDTIKGPVTVVHVMVLHPDGTIEDPSAILGMKGEYS